jgi:hypothetical protein
VAITAIHLLNRFADPTKDLEAHNAMKRMNRTLGWVCDQAYGVRQDVLRLPLANVGNSVRESGDAALLKLAYDTLCHRSELVTLQIDDVVAAPHADERRYSILLRKSKVN